MKNIVVLVSGGGTNLQALIDAQHSGKITGGAITCVISSNPNAYALERAAKNGIATEVIRRKDFAAFDEYDTALTELLKDLYVNYHFSETLDGDDVKFSYKLLEGPADSRNAIRLLRALGYDPGIADRAESRARNFIETGSWKL